MKKLYLVQTRIKFHKKSQSYYRKFMMLDFPKRENENVNCLEELIDSELWTVSIFERLYSFLPHYAGALLEIMEIWTLW